MKRCNTEELRRLRIVNLCDGACLGCADELEFDRETACILALVISGSHGLFGLGQEDDLIIPWRMIECFGEDTILVRLPPEEWGACCCPHKPRRHGKRP